VGKELYKESASWISVAADELIVACSYFDKQVQETSASWVQNSVVATSFLEVGEHTTVFGFHWDLPLWRCKCWKHGFEQVSSSYIIWLKPICSRCCGVMRTAASETSCLRIRYPSRRIDHPNEWESVNNHQLKSVEYSSRNFTQNLNPKQSQKS